MNPTKIWLAFAFVAAAAAELSLKQLLTICQIRGLSLLSKESLFLGKLYHTNETLSNVRFFHQDLEKSFTQDKEFVITIDPVQDVVQGEIDSSDGTLDVTKSLHPNLSLAVRLFPSPAGFIEPKTSLSCNFGFVVSRHFAEKYKFIGIDFLAFTLYYNSLTEEQKKTIKVSFTSFAEFRQNRPMFAVKAGAVEFKFELAAVSAKHKATVKKSVYDTLHLLFDPAYGDSNNILLNKSLIIQAFIVQLLDDESQYERFVNSFNKYQKDFGISVEQLPANSQILDNFIEINQKLLSFPYSLTSQPSQATIVPYYCRSKRDFIGGKFANCVESAAYHFLNCLFWNPTKNQYEFPTSGNAQKELIEFFSPAITLKSNLTLAQWLKWQRLVSDLGNGVYYGDKEADSPLSSIAYANMKKYEERDCLNELKPGILNLINVLTVLFDIKDIEGRIKPCLSLEDDKFKLNGDYFTELVKAVVFEITGGEGSIDVTCSDLKVEGSRGEKPVVIGKVTVTRNFGDSYVTLSLVIESSHAYVRVDKVQQPIFDISSAQSIATEFSSQADSRFVVPLFLRHSLSSIGPIEWKNPIKHNPDELIYEPFFLFRFGFSMETLNYLSWLNDALIIYMCQCHRNREYCLMVIDKITNIAKNIILILPFNDDVVERELKYLYALQRFLSNLKSLQQSEFSAVQKLSSDEVSVLSDVGGLLISKFPKFNWKYEANFIYVVRGIDEVRQMIPFRDMGIFNFDQIRPYIALEYWLIYRNVCFVDLMMYFKTFVKNELNWLQMTNIYWMLAKSSLEYSESNPFVLEKRIYVEKQNVDYFTAKLLDEIPSLLNHCQTCSVDVKEDLVGMLIYAWHFNSNPKNVDSIVSCIRANMTERLFRLICLTLNEKNLQHFSVYFADPAYCQSVGNYLMNCFRFPMDVMTNLNRLVSSMPLCFAFSLVVDFASLNEQCESLISYIHHDMQWKQNFNLATAYSPIIWYLLAQGLYRVSNQRLNEQSVLRCPRSVSDQLLSSLRGLSPFSKDKAEFEAIIERLSKIFRPFE